MNKTFNSKRFWKKLWFLLAGLHRQIILLLMLTIFTELIMLIGPYILKLIIDLLTNFNTKIIGGVIGLGILMFLINQLASLLDYFQDKKIFKILVESEGDLSARSFEKMMSLSLNYHEKENTGNKVLKIQRGIIKIQELLGNFFWDVAPTVFQVILTIATLFWVDWRFGIVISVFIPIFLAITFKTNKEVFPFRMKRFDNEEKASGIMTQAIVNINTVKSFVQEKRETKNYAAIIGKIINNVLKEFSKIIKANLSRNFTIDLGRLLLLLFGIFLVAKGEVTIGSLVFVFTISEKALFSMFRISRLYDRIMESSEAVERLYDLFLEKSDIKNKKNGIKPTDIQGKVSFKKVDFVYRESGIRALSEINLEIAAGSNVALVGPSGGGKTTIARMIYRHYDPTNGEVLLDGVNLKDYDIHAFRKFIAIVPQEVEIFNMSVRENIAYGKPSASLNEIKKAAEIANANEFIEKLVEKYDALVGERGLKLSGGQRQRIGIARAILANPKILIFDEATSNLDSQSEKLIQQAMEKIKQNRTMIVIAHRLSTIQKADKIVVLEEGRIVEEGTHEELIRINSGLYQKLNNLQKVGEVEED